MSGEDILHYLAVGFKQADAYNEGATYLIMEKKGEGIDTNADITTQEYENNQSGDSLVQQSADTLVQKFEEAPEVETKKDVELQGNVEQAVMENSEEQHSPSTLYAVRIAAYFYDGIRQAVKPLSSSATPVRAATLAPSGGGASDASEGKPPSKARQKKFHRHFPQVAPEEHVLNYYSCALVGDILLQGHLYITKNYFAFYSNVFGYVTKLLIPTGTVLRVTKEKMARIIPNAVGVCTRTERHVFGSLLSRDATYKLMCSVWRGARAVQPRPPEPQQELRISEAELDASEYSVEEETSSAGGGDQTDGRRAGARRETDALIAGPGATAAVIQPALLTGAPCLAPARAQLGIPRAALLLAAALLTALALVLAGKLYATSTRADEELARLSGSELYSELVRWRARLHGRAASELQAFLTTNLLLLTKVRQSLEALSGVILTDMAQPGPGAMHVEVPNDTTLS